VELKLELSVALAMLGILGEKDNPGAGRISFALYYFFMQIILSED